MGTKEGIAMADQYRNTAKIGILCGRQSEELFKAVSLLKAAGWEQIACADEDGGVRHVDDIASDTAVRLAAQMSRGFVGRCFVVAFSADVLDVPEIAMDIVERCSGEDGVDIVSRAVSLDEPLKRMGWLGKTWRYMLDARCEAALAGCCDWAEHADDVVAMMEQGYCGE